MAEPSGVRHTVAVDAEMLSTLEEVVAAADPDRGLRFTGADPGGVQSSSTGPGSTDRGEHGRRPAPPRSKHLAALALVADGLAPAVRTRSSKLTPKEIQSLLRSGRSVAQVAKIAGTDEEWVDRWYAPIQAERGQVLAAALAARLSKARLGPSRHPVGDAVAINLAAKGLTPDDQTVHWSVARRDGDEQWTIVLRYRNRGRSQRAVWRFDDETDELEAGNALAGEVGWTRSRVKVPAASPAFDAARDVVTRAGSLATPSGQGPAAQSASPARRPRTARKVAKKATGKKSAAKKSAAKKAMAKKSAAKKSAAKKSAAKKAAAKKGAAKKGAAKRAAARAVRTGDSAGRRRRT